MPGHSLTIDSLTWGTGAELAPAEPEAAGGSSLSSPQQWFLNAVTGNPLQEPGPAVNEFTAFNYATVYACVSLIASRIASLPLKVYKKVAGGKVEAKERSEYTLLHREFNPEMSAFSAREAGIAHLLTWGNSYTQIVRNKSGSQVIRLQPLGPDIVKARRTGKDGQGGALVYDIIRRSTGETLDTLESLEMLHVPGLSYDGLAGYSPIRVARSSIRAGMAQDKEAEKFVTRGVRPPGVIKFPPGKKFKDAQHAIQYRDTFRQIHSNEDGAISVMILEDGADWESIGIDPVSAQMLESRKYSRNEVCGIYRVPPHLVGGVEVSSSWGTGIAEQNQAFVDNCLIIWMARVEQELWRKLANGDEDIIYRHCVEEILRGDFTKRTDSLYKLHVRGILSDNEWRHIEHMNAREGGDVWHSPMNELRIDEEGDVVPGPSPPPAALPKAPLPAHEDNQDGADSPEQDDTDPTKPLDPTEPQKPGKAERVAINLRKGLASAVARCLRKESAEAIRAAGKPAAFVTWLDEFYGRHAEMVADTCGPLASSLADLVGAGPDDYPAVHLARSRADLLAAAEVPAARLAESVSRAVAKWVSDRPAEAVALYSPAPVEV